MHPTVFPDGRKTRDCRAATRIIPFAKGLLLLGVALTGALGRSALAQPTVTMSGQDGLGGSSFSSGGSNSSTLWESSGTLAAGAFPTSGYAYEVQSGGLLRTPVNSASCSFAG